MKALKIIVWIASVVLAGVFLMVGGMKLVTPTAVLAAASTVPVILMKIAGTAEVLGALGLILPAATRVLPKLTTLAACGLVLTMIGATTANVVTGAYSAVPMTVVLGLGAAFVAWARSTRCTVAPRERTQTASAQPA